MEFSRVSEYPLSLSLRQFRVGSSPWDVFQPSTPYTPLVPESLLKVFLSGHEPRPSYPSLPVLSTSLDITSQLYPVSPLCRKPSVLWRRSLTPRFEDPDTQSPFLSPAPRPTWTLRHRPVLPSDPDSHFQGPRTHESSTLLGRRGRSDVRETSVSPRLSRKMRVLRVSWEWCHVRPLRSPLCTLPVKTSTHSSR